MKFLILLILCSFISPLLSAQAKRERVTVLLNKNDSLSRLLKKERKTFDQDRKNYTDRISYLENELNKYDSSFTKAQSELSAAKYQTVVQQDSLETKEQYIARLELELSNAYASQGVRIGDQYWMSQNLNVSTFRNGDPIMEAKTNEEWISAADKKQPAWCYYDNLQKNGTKYGKLYNWYAVTDPRGLAPKGWRMPSMKDWDSLFVAVGGEDEAGFKMKNENGWEASGNGSNETGFSAMAGGFRDQSGVFFYPGISGYWWTTTEQNQYNGLCLYVNYYFNNFYRYYMNKKCGLSVRCIKER
jgi:uncharacterized protein (TIGR02145 family)